MPRNDRAMTLKDGGLDLNVRAAGGGTMIFQPYKGQFVTINYKNKDMPLQNEYGIVRAVGKGKGPRNVLVEYKIQRLEVIPRGNLVSQSRRIYD